MKFLQGKEWNIYAFLATAILIRLGLAFFNRSLHVPDEFWQNQEVAYDLVFGNGFRTWEWAYFTNIRAYIAPMVVGSMYYVLKLLHLDTNYVIAWSPRFLFSIISGIADVCLFYATLNWIVPSTISVKDVRKGTAPNAGKYIVIAKLATLCYFTNSFGVFLLSRPFINTLETNIFIFTLLLWPTRRTIQKAYLQKDFLGLFIKLFFTIFMIGFNVVTRVTAIVGSLSVLLHFVWVLATDPFIATKSFQASCQSVKSQSDNLDLSQSSGLEKPDVNLIHRKQSPKSSKSSKSTHDKTPELSSSHDIDVVVPYDFLRRLKLIVAYALVGLSSAACVVIGFGIFDTLSYYHSFQGLDVPVKPFISEEFQIVLTWFNFAKFNGTSRIGDIFGATDMSWMYTNALPEILSGTLLYTIIGTFMLLYKALPVLFRTFLIVQAMVLKKQARFSSSYNVDQNKPSSDKSVTPIDYNIISLYSHDDHVLDLNSDVSIFPLTVLWSAFFFSMFPHQETRFILPALPLAMITAAIGVYAYYLYAFSKNTSKSQRYTLMQILFSASILISCIVNFSSIIHRCYLANSGTQTIEVVRNHAAQSKHSLQEPLSIYFHTHCHNFPYFSILHEQEYATKPELSPILRQIDCSPWFNFEDGSLINGGYNPDNEVGRYYRESAVLLEENLRHAEVNQTSTDVNFAPGYAPQQLPNPFYRYVIIAPHDYEQESVQNVLKKYDYKLLLSSIVSDDKYVYYHE